MVPLSGMVLAAPPASHNGDAGSSAGGIHTARPSAALMGSFKQRVTPCILFEAYNNLNQTKILCCWSYTPIYFHLLSSERIVGGDGSPGMLIHQSLPRLSSPEAAVAEWIYIHFLLEWF